MQDSHWRLGAVRRLMEALSCMAPDGGWELLEARGRLEAARRPWEANQALHGPIPPGRDIECCYRAEEGVRWQG